MKRVAAFLLFALAAILFGKMIVEMRLLFSSAISFRLHHEAAAPLCVLLVWPILALAAVLRGAKVLGAEDRLGPDTEGADLALIALVPVLVGCSYLFQNEFFYSIYDPKGFPVHPPEIIAHPRGRWVTPSAHAFAALVLAVVMGIVWGVMRRLENWTDGSENGDV